MIMAGSFPTPDLARRSADPAQLARVERFAAQQAEVAEALRVRLVEQWPRRDAYHEKTVLLRDIHDAAVRWRYEQARRAPGRLGHGIPLDAERFRTLLRRGGPNFDRLGESGRLRTGAVWDPATRTYLGGQETPASRIMAAYGRAAAERIAAERPGRDVLENDFVLPTGNAVHGNTLVTGNAARRVTAELLARVQARGCDTSTMETGGNPVTAAPHAAEVMFGAAIGLLAGAVDERAAGERVTAWQQARYLLYQAPRMKKGSDAVTRVFLVAVGAFLFGVAPVLEQDVDLRCMVLGQAAAIAMPADDALTMEVTLQHGRGGRA